MSSITQRLSPRRAEGKSKTDIPGSTKKGTSLSTSAAGHEGKDSAEAIRSAFLSGQLRLDARCPLDDRQLYCISKSWKAINRNMSVTAINMFVR